MLEASCLDTSQFIFASTSACNTYVSTATKSEPIAPTSADNHDDNRLRGPTRWTQRTPRTQRNAKMNSSFKFAQINLRASNEAQYETELYLDQHQDFSCVFVSDLSWYLRQLETTYRTSSFHWIGKPGSCLAGLFLRNDIQYLLLDVTADRLTSVEVHSRTGNIILISVYLQPNILEGLDKLDQFLTSIADRHLPIVLCGDFNSHSKLWFDKTDDDQGFRIEELLLQHDLGIANQPASFSTFDNGHGGTSNIDLSLLSPSLIPKCHFWRICPWAIPSSDHSLIYFELDYAFRPEHKTRINWDAIDWTQQLAMAEENFLQLWILPLECNPGEIDCYLDTLVRVLQEVQGRFLIKRQTRYSKAWFTPEIKQLHETMRHAKRNSRRHPSESSIKRFRETKKTFQSRTKQVKQQLLGEFLENTTASTLWTSYNRLNKEVRTTKLPPLSSENGLAMTDAEKAKALSKHFFPNSTSGRTDTPAYTRWKDKPKTISVDEVITYADLWESIMWHPGFKRPDPDGLFSRTLQMTFPYYALSLQACLNSCLYCGYFPSRFREGTTLPVYKHGKEPQLSSSYRPLTMLSMVGKAFEKILQKKISTQLEQRDKLTSCQHGFRKDRTTQTSLFQLTDSIYDGYKTKRSTAVVSLDISSAYDSVTRDILMDRLVGMELSDNMVMTLDSFLRERRYNIRIDDRSEHEFFPERGIPQGSPLSPTLFLVYINNLPQKWSQKHSM